MSNLSCVCEVLKYYLCYVRAELILFGDPILYYMRAELIYMRAELFLFAYTPSSSMLCADNLVHVFKQEDDHGPMTEEEYDGGSTSEDEIISICRNNLVQSGNLISQLVPILGMYSDNYFVKLPRRVSGDSGWCRRH